VRVAPYENIDALKSAFTGVDKALLISSSEVGKRFRQHSNVIDAAKSAGVKHLVYTSAPGADTSELILAPEHKATESYLLQSALPYTIVRNNWYTENYVNQIETAWNTGVITAAAGEGRVASASRADYAAGAVEVLLGQGHEGKIYEFAGDYAWNYHELATAIARIIGKPVTYIPVDAATLRGVLMASGMDEGTAEFIAALDGNIAAGLLSGANGILSGLIGRPTTPLFEGLSAAHK
jgi:NAD(P)H dehydrogenase (quinone)